MDLRNTIINDIVLSLQESLTPEQIQDVKNSLYLKLNQYEVQERTTELTALDNSPCLLLKRFIATKRVEGKAESTLKRYYDVCSQMLNSINKPIEEITTYDLRYYLASYKEKRRVSNRTLDGMRRCFKSFFTWLTSEEIIQKNPSLSLAQIKYDKVIKHSYSDVDMELLKRSCDNLRDRAMVEFLYSSGCRVSELVSLNRTDVNFSTKEVVVLGKGGKERVVYLTNVALLYLQEYLESRTDNNSCLFASLGNPHHRLSKNGIEVALKKIGRKAGVENVHPHRYRRTLATNLINRGVSIQDVATILGHEDIKTTQIYCNINQDNVKTSHSRFIA